MPSIHAQTTQKNFWKKIQTKIVIQLRLLNAQKKTQLI